MSLIPLPLEKLLRALGRLPGLGPRSAQRAALEMLQHVEKLDELVRCLQDVRHVLGVCENCGNLAFNSQKEAMRCEICLDSGRDRGTLCVVEGIADLWAMEKSHSFTGVYMVLGGVVSALNGVGPEDVRIPQLVRRVRAEGVREVILALGASVEGQTTSHIIHEQIQQLDVVVTTLAKGMPVGAAVDYLDEGTLGVALAGRQRMAG